MKISVFSWNVLSDTFFLSDNYPSYDELIFDNDRKKRQVLKRIETQMEKKCLIALQEVCDFLMPDLVKLAVNGGYTIRDAYYGNETTGNMGVVLMWPTDLYKLDQYEQVVVGQYLIGEPPSPRVGWIDWVRGVEAPKCPYEYAKGRPNVLIAANLIGPDGPFTLAVYHMPCAYWDERIMKYHLDTIWSLCSNLNNPLSAVFEHLGDDTKTRAKYPPPLILCMDMNTKPTSSLYTNMKGYGMISAHAFEGDEPEFTIWTNTKSSDAPFKGTIDYIWVSSDTISEVKTEMAKCKDGLLPTASYPSDHLWTRAHLTFNNDKK